jgi:hypothetical protein
MAALSNIAAVAVAGLVGSVEERRGTLAAWLQDVANR